MNHDTFNHDIYISPYTLVTLNHPMAYIKYKIYIYYRGWSRVTTNIEVQSKR
jgi:hypothetical protein